MRALIPAIVYFCLTLAGCVGVFIGHTYHQRTVTGIGLVLLATAFVGLYLVVYRDGT